MPPTAENETGHMHMAGPPVCGRAASGRGGVRYWVSDALLAPGLEGGSGRDYMML